MKLKTVFAVLCLISLFGLLLSSNTVGHQAAPDAQSILKRMAEEYGKCSSYQDTGLLRRTGSFVGLGKTTIDEPFKTYFKRPHLFRFEWIDNELGHQGKTMMVWSNGHESYIHWKAEKYEKTENLGIGIMNASLASAGSAGWVPDLLMPEWQNHSLLGSIKDVSLNGEEVVEGVPCYYIMALSVIGLNREYWIGKEDFLLRKFKETDKSDSMSIVSEEIRRNIKINADIAPEIFNFKPPIALTESK